MAVLPDRGAPLSELSGHSVCVALEVGRVVEIWMSRHGSAELQRGGVVENGSGRHDPAEAEYEKVVENETGQREAWLGWCEIRIGVAKI